MRGIGRKKREKVEEKESESERERKKRESERKVCPLNCDRKRITFCLVTTFYLFLSSLFLSFFSLSSFLSPLLIFPPIRVYLPLTQVMPFISKPLFVITFFFSLILSLFLSLSLRISFSFSLLCLASLPSSPLIHTRIWTLDRAPFKMDREKGGKKKRRKR